LPLSGTWGASTRRPWRGRGVSSSPSISSWHLVDFGLRPRRSSRPISARSTVTIRPLAFKMLLMLLRLTTISVGNPLSADQPPKAFALDVCTSTRDRRSTPVGRARSGAHSGRQPWVGGFQVSSNTPCSNALPGAARTGHAARRAVSSKQELLLAAAAIEGEKG
jgi:hypothetical protein